MGRGLRSSAIGAESCARATRVLNPRSRCRRPSLRRRRRASPVRQSQRRRSRYGTTQGNSRVRDKRYRANGKASPESETPMCAVARTGATMVAAAGREMNAKGENANGPRGSAPRENGRNAPNGTGLNADGPSAPGARNRENAKWPVAIARPAAGGARRRTTATPTTALIGMGMTNREVAAETTGIDLLG